MPFAFTATIAVLVAVLKEDDVAGKIAITNYEVLEEYDFLSLLKLNLKTGRTHQIRVHLASLGHPVFGDETYGGREPHSVTLTSNIKARIKNLLEIMPRQALHARLLGFIHPVTNKEMLFESELPGDMKDLLLRIKN